MMKNLLYLKKENLKLKGKQKNTFKITLLSYLKGLTLINRGEKDLKKYFFF